MFPKLFDLGPLTIYTYGVLLAAAYLAGLRLAMTRAQRFGLDANRVLDLGIYIIISALLGAKLLLLVVEWRTLTSSPAEMLTLLRSGGDDTMVTDAFSGLHARAIRNTFAREYAASGAPVLPSLLQANAADDIYRAAASTGNAEYSCRVARHLFNQL